MSDSPEVLTPWGEAYGVQVLRPGIQMVHTDAHGGLMIECGYATQHLPLDVIRKGQVFRGYICYEEDGDILYPLLLLPQLWPRIYQVPGSEEQKDTWRYLVRRLTIEDPEFLVGRGIPLDVAAVEGRPPLYNWRVRVERTRQMITAVDVRSVNDSNAQNLALAMTKEWSDDSFSEQGAVDRVTDISMLGRDDLLEED